MPIHPEVSLKENTRDLCSECKAPLGELEYLNGTMCDDCIEAVINSQLVPEPDDTLSPRASVWESDEDYFPDYADLDEEEIESDY